MTTQIIYINGPSSSGKSTLARALQENLDRPFLHIGIDTLIWMMPAKINNWSGYTDTIGFSWKPAKDSNGFSIQELHVGKYAQKIIKSYQDIVLLLARSGHNLIIDDVALEHANMRTWQNLLREFSVLYVGVHTPLDILEKREKERGDRMIGSSRHQFFKVHKENEYDLEIDSSLSTIEQCVESIQQALKKLEISSNIEILPLKEADIPIIVENFKKFQWDKPASLFEKYLFEQTEGRRMVWVANFNNQFAGYITLKWESQYSPFALKKIPEIMDLNVLPNFRKRGIGSKLLETAENFASTRSQIIGLGVGLYCGSDGGYGAAQKLYVKNGYVPDGLGVTYQYKAITPGRSIPIDDDLILWFTKKLNNEFDVNLDTE